MAHDEEMRLAAVHLRRAAERAAERDHELRNGLAGLSGITTLLSSSATSDEREGLRSAMLTELARLAAMIDTGEPARSPAPAGRYDVAVELRAAGAAAPGRRRRIGLRPPGAELFAAGKPAVLAQVMANLLANCARHAAGSAVRVQAARRGARIVVTVRDDGPGIPPGQELAVLERGVRDPQPAAAASGCT